MENETKKEESTNELKEDWRYIREAMKIFKNNKMLITIGYEGDGVVCFAMTDTNIGRLIRKSNISITKALKELYNDLKANGVEFV